MIETIDLRRHFTLGGETIRALDGVSLRIENGESVAMLGPSGSGKSTLMHLLGGLDTPTGGEIRVDGEDLGALDRVALARYRNRKVGFVFQAFNLQPHLTALENVELPLKIGDVARRERRRIAEERLVDVGLRDRLNHTPAELSGGQRQRVSIARALANSPRFLLADEPTGNLDSKTGHEIADLFLRLNRERGITLVIVTHNPEMAGICGRQIVLRDGRVVEESTAAAAGAATATATSSSETGAST